MKTTLKMLLAATLATGCGAADKGEDRKDNSGNENKDDGTTDTGDGTTDGGALVVADSEVAGQSVSSQIDEAISRVVEDQDADAGASLALAEVTTEGEAKRYRNCTEQDGKAVVEIKRSLSLSRNFEGPKRVASASFKVYDERTRTWSKTGGAVACSDNKKHAKIPWGDMEGVKLDVVGKHEREREMSVENTAKGTSFKRSLKHSIEGERHIVWTSVVEEEGVLKISKELTGEAKRKLEATDKDGQTKTLEGTIKSVEGAPLKVLVVRDATTFEPESRTIQSGSLESVGKDGHRVLTKFDNVVYERQKGCVATSGKITGEIYKKDEQTASLTFEITFDGDTKSITFSDGKQFEYTPEGCDFDDPATIAEADKADDVKAPTE